jgi:hypothetical protein
MGISDTGNFAINQNLFLPISPILFNTPQFGFVFRFSKEAFYIGRFLFNLGLIISSWVTIKYFMNKVDFKQIMKKKLILFLLIFLFAINLFWPKILGQQKYSSNYGKNYLLMVNITTLSR